LVIFDCDGVLVDSEEISNRVLAEMLTAQGLPMTTAEARASYQGWLLKDIVRDAGDRRGEPLAEGWVEDYERVRADVFRADLRAIPGVKDVAHEIVNAGAKICVASQGSRHKMALTLGITALDQLFPARSRFSADDVERGKPHPDLFLHAAAAMGFEPARSVVVEDTPSGVQAAVAAEMRVLGFTADSDAELLAEAGAEGFASMEQLSGLLLLQ
jgi:HAD superfamily hydrolase (TIGR01509 family)